ncbi:hypothetical protein KSP39_PZI010131 [Platanthera zijinensis]|uniref:3-hydroxyisobutyrate dehydrogenase n=1 Tax=Platanthera zijinensis TaxID=2320716 RepID=A0AAP0BJ18_9ASPA
MCVLQKVGFIGLGNMGFHMANNLINAGYKLTVNDIDQSTMRKFSDKGISAVETPFEVAESSDVVITMLPSSSHVSSVYTGEYGLLHGGSQLRPWLFIDSSTIDPYTSRKLSMNISQCLVKESKGNPNSPVMLDAPVSGGVLGAAARTLTFMVGGLEDAYLAAKPLFLAMGKNTVYCGGPGNGAAAKICNNLAMAVSMLGVSEALALGQGLGISASTLTNIFNSSSARCWSSDSYNPVPGIMEGVPSSRSYAGGFSSKLMRMDKGFLAISIEYASVNRSLSIQTWEVSSLEQASRFETVTQVGSYFYFLFSGSVNPDISFLYIADPAGRLISEILGRGVTNWYQRQV